MKKGIVMEIDDAFLTLLTPDGEFLRAKKLEQPYSLGEEIHFFPIEHYPSTQVSKGSRFIKARSVWLTAAAFLVFIGTFLPIYQDNKAYAYMSIDVNPSIELGVNKKMQVVELTGFNKEGKQVISHLKDWKKMDISSLTETILTEIKKEGYLENNHHIIISTVRTEQPETKVEQKLQENMKEIRTAVTDENLNLTLVSGTEKELEMAHKLGITAGKLQAENNIKNKKNVNSNIKHNGNGPDSSSQQVDQQGQIGTQTDQSSVPGTTNQLDETGKKVPPGQLKKENTNSLQDQKIEPETNPVVKQQPQVETNSLPPGQLKKIDEGKVKQSQEQKNANQQMVPSKQQAKSNQKQKKDK